jgi:hypothetical protein
VFFLGGGLMAAVVDRSRWPVVRVSVEEPADLDAIAGALESILDEERPFALTVLAPDSLDALHEMLWAAPNARRRIRRLRPRLAAWCESVAHVMSERAYARTCPSDLRCAQLVWGCGALSARTADEASGLLHALLADRPLRLDADVSTVAA